jgi:hypothetical protein
MEAESPESESSDERRSQKDVGLHKVSSFEKGGEGHLSLFRLFSQR